MLPICLIMLSLLVAAAPLAAAPIPQAPEKGRFIVDAADALTPAQEQALAEKHETLLKEHGQPFVVLVIASPSSDVPDEMALVDYAATVANEWYPYREFTDEERERLRKGSLVNWHARAVVAVLAIDAQDAAVHLGDYHSPLVKRRRSKELRDYLLHYLAEGSPARGIEISIEALTAAKLGKPLPPLPRTPRYYAKVALFLLLLAWMFHALVYKREVSALWYYPGLVFWSILALFTSAAITSEIAHRRRHGGGDPMRSAFKDQ